MQRTFNALALLVVLALGVVIGSAASVARGDVLRVGGDVVRVELHYADGRVQVFEAQPTATPTRTATATATSTPPATNTPRPTVTPPPVTAVGTLYGTEAPLPDTLTPTITSTPPITPTPDTLPATGTPPTAPPVSCEVQLQDFNIRLRAAPTTGAAIIGSVQARTTHQVFEATEGAGYLWVYDGRGWFAIRQSDWWVWRVHATNCDELPGWPDGMPPPPLLTQAETVYSVGFKAVPGAKLDDIRQFDAALPDDIGSVAFVVQDPNLTSALYSTDTFTVFVPWTQWPGDCPNTAMSPVNSAGDRLRYVASQAQGAQFDAVVIANECAFPRAEWYRDWLIAVMDGCDQRGWQCIPHVWNTGAPELDWLPVLDDAHCQMAARGHLYGANIYPYYNVPLMSDDTRTLFTTWRHRKIQAAMRCAPVWAVTELAPGDGSLPPDVQDTAAYLDATRGDFGYVGVWYIGQLLNAWRLARWVAAQMDALAAALTE